MAIPVLALLGLGGVGLRMPGVEPISNKVVSARVSSNEVARLVELRGRVVCLPEEMHREYKADLPTKHEHLWGIKTSDGQCYLILRGRFSESIWLDERVRAKELVVRARLLPKSHVLEFQGIKSVRANVVQDLYYYCDVCAIKSVSPELCACCQGPVELVEKPLSEREE